MVCCIYVQKKRYGENIMRKMFFIAAAAALLSCTACGSAKIGKADEDVTASADTVTSTAETTKTTVASKTASNAASTETTTAETTTAEFVQAGGEASENVDTQPQRPAGVAPSPSDADYAPAPVQYNREGITYIDGVLIANKSYSLPSDFNPGLDPTCEAQFYKLSAAAAKEGRNITFSSGFRTYDYQSIIYNSYVDVDGQAVADTYSARPGYSEHQSGLAIDVNSITHDFDGTPEARWLEEHCHEYGFILRYPNGKENITGYQYESWHIRYVGTDISYPVHASGLTLEEYFEIDSYYHD